MAFGSFNDAPGIQPMAEINTTPLVDVMLVLLVIFIITAPLFHQAVQVDLPRVDSTKLQDKPVVIQVAIDVNGGVFIDGMPVLREELDATLAGMAAKARNAHAEVHLRADRTTNYEKVTDVMAAVQKAGLVRIAFVTDAKR